LPVFCGISGATNATLNAMRCFSSCIDSIG
jgi:hypothetical protein